MSLHDNLTSAQRALDDLVRSVSRLHDQLGDNLDMRRVRADVEHLRNSLALLRDSVPGGRPSRQTPEMVKIPDAPYDPALWADAEDEGLGSRHRHAP